MRRLLLIAAAATLLAGTGCSTPCEDLASAICACEGSTAAIDACERRAQQTEDILAPTDAEQEQCDSFLESCDCHALGTAEGKRACGLAE